MSRRSVMAGAMMAALAPRGRAQPVTRGDHPSLWQEGAPGVTLHRFSVARPGPGAAHLIHLAVPSGPAPDGGWPVLCALDGAAVGEVFAGSVSLPADRAVLAIGYEGGRRYALEERTADYTPPDMGGAAIQDPTGRVGGGADLLLSRILSDILPRAGRLAPLSATERTLWGHSYGGLFALYAAFLGAPFSRFVAASPSLWWDTSRYWRSLLAQAGEGRAPAVRLDLHSGDAEHAPRRASDDPKVQAMLAMRASLPETALSDLDAALRQAGTPGRLTWFPGLGHGQSFAASLAATAGAQGQRAPLP